MSGPSGDRRPPQVTWGAALAVVSGVLLVANAFDALAGLRSVATREQLAKALDTPQARQLGVGVGQATTALHVLLLVGGAAAAVAVVLAGYAYLRHTGARAALAGAAVVALVGSLVADPLLGILLVLGTGLLWSAPARIWFRPERAAELSGTKDRQRDDRAAEDALGVEAQAGRTHEHPPPPGPTPDPPRAAAAPPPTYGFGTPAGPVQHPPYGVPQPPQVAFPLGRWRPPAPGSVKAAVALTWTCCVLAMIGLLAAAALLANDRARVLDALRQQPGYERFAAHQDALVGALWFADAAFAAWTIAAAVVAVFVLRGHAWARVLLLVSAGLAALVSLAAFPASVFHVVGSVVVFALLLSRSATAWFRQRGAAPGAPGGPGAPRPPDPPVW